jgi:hypothetical protein
MSSQIRPAPIAARRQSGHARYGHGILLVVVALAIQGCVAAQRPLVGPDADDPDVRVPATVYRSAIGEFKSTRPSEPAPWRDQGGSDTSKPKADGQ